MSTKAEVILDQIRSLAVKDQKDLWQELGRRIGQTPPAPPVEQYGEPLTDEDIEQSARVAFQALDQEEKRAETR
jgi:hypothetical protein